MDSFIARQPIFDAGQKVVAYELLFRSGPENFFTGTDHDSASSQVIGESLHGFGLIQLVGSKKAFVNITRRVLVDGLAHVLPTSTCVIELLETVDPDPEVLSACRELKRAGYILALDDFVARPDYEPLVALADVIKIDFIGTPRAERLAMAERFQRRGIKVLAEKVETREEFAEAKAAGFAYFQGYFFCRPEIMTRREVPAAKQNCLTFLQEVTRADLDYSRLEPIIRQDVGMTIKLLRFLNSAFFGFKMRVTSIRHGLVLLGERSIRQWASLMAMVALGEGKPPEILTVSLARARFCELAGEAVDYAGNRDDLFLMGLLSTMDALMDRPLAELLAEMPIGPEIRSALLGDDSMAGRLFALCLASEKGDWEAIPRLCHALGLEESVAAGLSVQSLEWADRMPRP